MIAGLGIDLVEVERIAEKLNKSDDFRDLVFSANEIAYCEAKANKYEHYAARFAAKEAFFKALGTGWTTGTAFNEVEITNDGEGRPAIVLLNETQKTVNEMQITGIVVSLTHIKTAASAVVILEK